MGPLAPAGALIGGWFVMRAALSRAPGFVRRPVRNYRGVEIPGALGALLIVPLFFGGLVAWARPAWVMVSAGCAMGLLGLLDDLFAGARAGGFAGHFRALMHGRLTTGLLKAAGGGVTGLAVAYWLGDRGVWVLADGALIALAANLANLLDLRPGRTTKVWLPAWVAVAVAGPPFASLVASAGLAGGLIAFVAVDLLGAAWGVLAVESLGSTGRLATLAVLAVLTIASEVVSFSDVIERVSVLRAVDRLGRAKP
jgi:hypothetical protein